MKVVQVCIGRFHHFDLARQLDRRGMLEVVFTGYPWNKLRGEGLSRNRVRSHPWIQAPYMGLMRLGLSGRLIRELSWQAQDRLDRRVARELPAADWLFAMSGSGQHSGRAAKAAGMGVVCDRGSSHIRYQQEILREEFRCYGEPFTGADPRMIEKEEAEYAGADLITVPSEFALQSFVESGVSPAKLRKVPYGVELSRFRQDGEPPPGEFRVLFAGQVGIRKGLRYLLESFSRLRHPRKHLTVVGGLTPEARRYLARQPVGEEVSFVGHLPQAQLVQAMSRSHLMVLPSVEDGFGLVMAEALACGCPVLASRNTGASDLFADGDAGFIVEPRSSAALLEKMQQLAEDQALRQRMSEAALQRVRNLGGWDRYGEMMVQTVLRERGGSAP